MWEMFFIFKDWAWKLSILKAYIFILNCLKLFLPVGRWIMKQGWILRSKRNISSQEERWSWSSWWEEPKQRFLFACGQKHLKNKDYVGISSISLKLFFCLFYNTISWVERNILRSLIQEEEHMCFYFSKKESAW